MSYSFCYGEFSAYRHDSHPHTFSYFASGYENEKTLEFRDSVSSASNVVNDDFQLLILFHWK